MAFGNVPKDAAGIPIGGLYTPNTGFAAFQGGTQTTDGSGNVYAPAEMHLADGAQVTLGAKADVAQTDATQTASTHSFIKGIVKILADMWDSTNHWLQVKVMNGNANGVATSVNSAPVVTASDDANFLALKPGVQGWIAPTGTGTASTDDSLTFANQVRKIILYNASANPIPIEFDVASSATSFPVPAGAYWVLDNVYCTVVHVFPSVLLPINTTAGLYIKGWK